MSELYDYNYNENMKENEFNQDEFNGGYEPKQPKKNNNFLKSKLVKKIGAITLSAVLFGGVAAGTFQGINYISGFANNAISSTSTSSANNSSSSLLKAASTSTSSTISGSIDVSSIAENAMPSIVSITNKSVQEVQNYFNMFGYGAQTQQQEVESCGSGIIIGKNDTELLIVTNNHVVEDATTLSVCFIDNQAYEAQIKGTDSDNDLAVIAVSLDQISDDTMSQIAVATIGDSDALKVGEQVVAIGNALGYGQSVTTGIVSAKDRTISTSSSTDSSETVDTSQTYIQTDAAINPGNSGGALLNMNGEVIGINSAKLASTEVEGMGYAIPMSRVSDIVENLMNQTTRTKVSEEQQAYLGIKGASVTSDIQQAYGIPTGVYVTEVTQGSAAEAAGIPANSVITKFDGKSVSDISELQDLLQYYSAGETVEVTLQVAADGSYSEQTVSVTLGKASNTVSTSDSSSSNSRNSSSSFGQSNDSSIQGYTYGTKA